MDDNLVGGTNRVPMSMEYIYYNYLSTIRSDGVLYTDVRA